MKRLFNSLFCAAILCAIVSAQQPAETQQPDQNKSFGVRPTAEMLMKLQEPAKQTQPQKSEGKVEAATILPDERQKSTGKGKFPALIQTAPFVLINGAIYTPVGGALIPVPGGGASGCFSVLAEK